ncbi:MAG: CRISPR-associated helicase Cas3' [Gammaproteobacteria bacterium]
MNSKTKEFIAHVKPTENGFVTHDLCDHLMKVAQLAAYFAKEIGEDWAELAGRWHDLGKYRPAFQAYIQKESGYDPDAHVSGEYSRKTAHASTGAVYASQQGPWGRVLAYLIAGHHAGLPDYEHDCAQGRGLREIVHEDESMLKEALDQSIPEHILRFDPPTTIPKGGIECGHLWIRMLFSCLVDADFLDTERFMDPDKATRRSQPVTMPRLLDCFNQFTQQLRAQASDTLLNRIRNSILLPCRIAARKKPGVFTLTVPTGGGKTLSSLAFALEHAALHNKQRIIYAIPYTSIIEQTADIFRELFAPLGEILVEHHSNTDADQFNHENNWSRLATENWDAPLIVTTTVQLFESLYAARTSRCRKLHNLVNSVIVIDETQLLPIQHLKPIRHAIDVLKAHYGVTFVLSTATPTGLDSQHDPFGRRFLQGIESEEIIQNPEQHYAALKRVSIELPQDFDDASSWEAVRDRLVEHESVLCVVNTRRDARTLFELMPKGCFHLSATMCAEHRSKVIESIRSRLKKGQATRVVSTQLIEAGVDLDFPVVFRALAGLDSIVQSAGRCNREGKLELGRVVVFVPPSKTPPGLLTIGAHTAISLLSGFEGKIDAPETFKAYFNSLFCAVRNLDQSNLLSKLQKNAEACQFQFRTAAREFRMIEDEETVSVFVRYGEEGGEVDRWLSMLAHKPERWLLRKLQRYSVSVYRYQFEALRQRGEVEEISPGYYAQSKAGVYSEKTGLQIEIPELTPSNTVI